MDSMRYNFILILLSAMTTENILLSRFLGMCPFLSVSKNLRSSIGLGAAVLFVMSCTSVINWYVYHFLVKCRLEYLQYIAFIAVIAAFVQIVEMAIERFSQRLHLILGIFLPLTTVNCAILGCSLFAVARGYNVFQTAAFGVGSGLGWMLAIVAMAGIRMKMARCSQVIPDFEGTGIALVAAGSMAIAFSGFSFAGNG